MEDIFYREERVVDESEKLLDSGMIETDNDIRHYRTLLDEYKKLLRQMALLIKVSDLNHSELKLLSTRHEIASNIDVLTGLYNRRYFNEVYQREWQNALQAKYSLASIMIDIDYFKRFNDIYGHLQGDLCLNKVSEAIKKSASRPRDIVARFGGEEFIVFLPDTDIKGAVNITEKIINGIGKLNIINAGSSVSGKVTVSIGIAAMIPQETDASDDLLDKSDQALYRAKTEGRNCYRIYYR